eukprot:jgi/Galph1/3384/GphlegSOOS_G2040.1
MLTLQKVQTELRQLAFSNPDDAETYIDTLPVDIRNNLLDHVRDGLVNLFEGQHENFSEHLASTIETIRAVLLNHSLRDSAFVALFERLISEDCSTKEKSLVSAEIEQGFFSVVRDSKISLVEKLQELEEIWVGFEGRLSSARSSDQVKTLDVLVSLSKTAMQVDKVRGSVLSENIARVIIEKILNHDNCANVLGIIGDLYMDDDLFKVLRRNMLAIVDSLDPSNYLSFMKGLVDILRSSLRSTNDNSFAWIRIVRFSVYSAPSTVFSDILCLFNIEISNVPKLGSVICQYYDKLASGKDSTHDEFVRLHDIAVLLLIFSAQEDLKNDIARVIVSMSEQSNLIEMSSSNGTIGDALLGLFFDLIAYQDLEYLLPFILELCYLWLGEGQTYSTATKKRAISIVVEIFQRQACCRPDIVHSLFFEMAEPGHSLDYKLYLCDIIDQLVSTNIIDLASLACKIQDALQFLDSLPIAVCRKFFLSLSRLATVSHHFAEYLFMFCRKKAFGQYLGRQSIGVSGFISILTERNLQHLHEEVMNSLYNLVERGNYGSRLIIYDAWKYLLAHHIEDLDHLALSYLQDFISKRLIENSVDWNNGILDMKKIFRCAVAAQNSDDIVEYPDEPVAHLLLCLWTIDPKHSSLIKFQEWFDGMPTLIKFLFSLETKGEGRGCLATSVLYRVRLAQNVSDVLWQITGGSNTNNFIMMETITCLYYLEDFLSSRVSLPEESERMFFGLPASNLLLEKDFVANLKSLEKCLSYDVLINFIAANKDNIYCLNVFLRKLSNYVLSESYMGENNIALGNLMLQLVASSQHWYTEHSLKKDFNFDHLQQPLIELFQEFRHYYLTVSPRQTCLLYLLTILEKLLSNKSFSLERDIQVNTFQGLENIFADDEQCDLQYSQIIVLFLWKFFENEFERKEGMPSSHAHKYLQLVLEGLDQCNLGKFNHLPIGRRVIRVLSKYEIQQATILRLLIRILTKSFKESTLLFPLLQYIAMIYSCNSTSKNTYDKPQRQRKTESNALFSQGGYPSKPCSNQTAIPIPPNLRSLMKTSQIPPPENENCRVGVLIAILQELESRYLQAGHIPNLQTFEELMSILTVIRVILMGDIRDETEQRSVTSIHLNIPQSCVNRCLQLVSKISKTVCQLFTKVRKDFASWQTNYESIRMLCAFLEQITTHVHMIIQWALKRRGHSSGTCSSPVLPKIQFHFARLQVEFGKLMAQSSQEILEILQPMTQKFETFHQETKSEFSQDYRWSEDKENSSPLMEKKNTRKKFRSRNRFIDACLVEEETGGDDYADLEDFLVMDNEDQEPKPHRVIDWVKRVIPK